MSRRRERGVALLGVVAALTALDPGGQRPGTTAALDRRRTADALESLQADALARSAVATAAVLLGEQATRRRAGYGALGVGPTVARPADRRDRAGSR